MSYKQKSTAQKQKSETEIQNGKFRSKSASYK